MHALFWVYSCIRISWRKIDLIRLNKLALPSCQFYQLVVVLVASRENASHDIGLLTRSLSQDLDRLAAACTFVAG